MFNNKGESKMETTILVIRRSQFGNCKPNYHTEKSAKTLEEAMRYKVALELLNNEKEITYLLFNEVGQFDIERIEKVADETK
jgi:hypothetical protein